MRQPRGTVDDTALVTWAAGELGLPALRARDVSWDHAASHVLALAAPEHSAPLAFLKVHRQARKYRQEVHALRRWAPLAGSAPRLLAARGAAPQALLLSARPGRGVDQLAPDDPRLVRAHAAAGAWLRRLHDLPFVDDDPVPLADALRMRLASWAQRQPDAFAPATLARLGGLLDAADWSGAPRRPCHGDFSPRNWLWDDAVGLSVIDFEHAKPDAWVVDVHGLIDGPWRARPDLEAAFWDGYGGLPTQADAARITAVRALYAVGTVAWGRAHGDGAFAAAGAEVLRRLGALDA